jgi:hypothetical protein
VQAVVTPTTPAAKAPEGGAVVDLPPLPPYGMAALGQSGAWKGDTESGSGMRTDTSGNVCLDAKDYTTTQLRQMLPATKSDDGCFYLHYYLSRNDVPPSDVLAFKTYFDGFSLRDFVKSGLWRVSDFEQLAHRKLSPYAALNVYLILKQANSPLAGYVAGRQDDGIEDRHYLDLYLQTGACPESDMSQFCLVK